MQTEIGLPSTDAQYIALSQSMREVIPLMELMKEAKEMNIPIVPSTPKIHCKIFEDNSGAIEIAKVPKMRPKTKYMNIKYHHFRDYVKKGLVTIQQVSTMEQIADIFTKPLGEAFFQQHHKSLIGW